LKLRNAVIDVIRFGYKSEKDDVTLAREFDLQDRFVQLNILAYAFDTLGTPPMFLRSPIGRRIRWENVGNPSHVRNVADELAKAERHILRRYGQSVRLRPAKFEMRDWGIEDLSWSGGIREELRRLCRQGPTP
jgi:hypothetical protein